MKQEPNSRDLGISRLQAGEQVNCANCRRPLKHPAAEVGRMKFGRICAQRLGLIPSPEPRGLFAGMNPPVKRDQFTQDLFADKDHAQ